MKTAKEKVKGLEEMLKEDLEKEKSMVVEIIDLILSYGRLIHAGPCLSTFVELFSPTVGEEPLQYLSASLSNSLNLVFFITRQTLCSCQQRDVFLSLREPPPRCPYSPSPALQEEILLEVGLGENHAILLLESFILSDSFESSTPTKLVFFPSRLPPLPPPFRHH